MAASSINMHMHHAQQQSMGCLNAYGECATPDRARDGGA
jgi:hypothetical protein